MDLDRWMKRPSPCNSSEKQQGRASSSTSLGFVIWLKQTARRFIKRKSLFFLFLFLTWNACHKVPNEAATDLDMSHFHKDWVHSYEEQTSDSVQIYRPHDYKDFPSSRFRMRYIFEQNGSCQWLVLHPADAHYLESGTWRTDGEDDREILLWDQQRSLQTDISFEILELRKDILKMKSIDYMSIDPHSVSGTLNDGLSCTKTPGTMSGNRVNFEVRNMKAVLEIHSESYATVAFQTEDKVYTKTLEKG